MQIFSHQAAMMDALISHFAEQMRRRKEGTDGVVAENVADDGNELIDSNYEQNVNILLILQNQILFKITALAY
jgi:hypothetical protein